MAADKTTVCLVAGATDEITKNKLQAMHCVWQRAVAYSSEMDFKVLLLKTGGPLKRKKQPYLRENQDQDSSIVILIHLWAGSQNHVC